MAVHTLRATISRFASILMHYSIHNSAISGLGDLKDRASRTTVRMVQQLASSRDVVVFATGVVLMSAGLLPAAETLCRLQRETSTSAQLHVLASLTSLDKATIAISTTVAFIGFALLFASTFAARVQKVASVMSVMSVLGSALFAMTLAVAILLGVIVTQQKQPSVWDASVFTQREDLFEARVNDVYCHVKGAQVCQVASLGEAKQVFPLESWPVGAVSQPGKTILSTCEEFDESVRQWGYPVKMELCRLCHTITKEEQRGGDELLNVVDDISFQELQWCGEYLVNDERETRGQEDVRESPYRKNRHAFQQVLTQSEPAYTLTLGTRVLLLLISAAIPCLLSLFYSLRAVKSSLAVSGGNDKIQV